MYRLYREGGLGLRKRPPESVVLRCIDENAVVQQDPTRFGRWTSLRTSSGTADGFVALRWSISLRGRAWLLKWDRL